MKIKGVLFLLLTTYYSRLTLLWAEPVLRAPVKTASKDEVALVRDLTHGITGLGIISPEEKKLMGNTIEKEKAQILRRTMEQIYDNAYELYRKGEYQDAKTLLERIVVLDPSYDRANALLSALNQVPSGSQVKLESPKSIKQIIEDKFLEAVSIYRDGRKVEAVGKFEEVIALEPRHRKAKYYIEKINGELAEEYFEKAKFAYTQGRLDDALEAFYTATNLDPKRYSFLTRQITQIESDIRGKKVQQYLATSITALNEGRWLDARDEAKQIFKLDPANTRAQEIIDESLRSEAQGYLALGDALVAKKKYQDAIENYEKVIKLGARLEEARKRIDLAKSKIKQDEESVRKKVEEEKAKKEAEDRAKSAMGQTGQEGKEESSGLDSAQTKAEAPTAGVAPAPAAVSEEAKKASESHYQQAMQFYQTGDLSHALAELNIALKFDANNQNAYAAKHKIEAEMAK